jgi:hypothetical protein
VISSVVSPVSEMIADEVLFTVPPWEPGCRVEAETPEAIPASLES